MLSIPLAKDDRICARCNSSVVRTHKGFWLHRAGDTHYLTAYCKICRKRIYPCAFTDICPDCCNPITLDSLPLPPQLHRRN